MKYIQYEKNVKDLFTFSQSKKEKIEGSRYLMNKINQYAEEYWSGISLEHLGTGINNTHYRLGQLEQGIWLGTREYLHAEGYAQCIIGENYARDIERFLQNGEETIKLCIGVRVHRGIKGDRYFFIVEDLTEGGKKCLISVGPGSLYSLCDEKKVYHDTEERGECVSLRWMADESVIHIRK